LEKGLGVKAKLVRGSGGIFDVSADGKVVYSKHRTGRFPHPGEVLGILKGRP
jgi:selT/selW/selH-like putative selenoprotein